MLDDKIKPGDTFAYVWGVPERAGPVPETEGSSNVWLYHSHVDEVADTYAGLVGPIVVTRHGHADADGKPKDIDREFFAFFQIFDENKSRMFGDNLKKYLPGIDLSLLMPSATNGMMSMTTDSETGMDIGGMDMGGTDTGSMNMAKPATATAGMDMDMGTDSGGRRRRQEMEGNMGTTMNMANTGTDAGTVPSMMDLMSQDDDTPMILHSHNFEELEAEHASFYESNRMHSINGYVCRSSAVLGMLHC